MCFNAVMFQPTMQEIDFTAEVLDPRVSVSRASGGTRFNSAGTMETISANLPRFDYDPATLAFRGVLVEEQRTNLVIRSTELDYSTATTWTKTGIQTPIGVDVAVAPDGTMSADKLTEDTSTGVHNARQTVVLVSGTTYAFSTFAKASDRTQINFYGAGGLSSIFGAVNLTNGAVISGTPVVKSSGSGWWRVSSSGASTFTGNNLVYIENRNNTGSYTGTAGYGALFWGMMLETGKFATSFIPTTSASATRYADDVTLTTLAAIRYNPAGGTLYVSGTAPPYLAQAAVLASFNDNSSSQVIRLRMDTSGVLRAEVIDGGVTQASLALGTLTAGQSFRAVMSYAANDVRGKLQGGSAQADTSATIPTVDRLMIGRGTGGEYWNSGIKRVIYYPGPLSDAEQASLVA